MNPWCPARELTHVPTSQNCSKDPEDGRRAKRSLRCLRLKYYVTKFDLQSSLSAKITDPQRARYSHSPPPLAHVPVVSHAYPSAHPGVGRNGTFLFQSGLLAHISGIKNLEKGNEEPVAACWQNLPTGVIQLRLERVTQILKAISKPTRGRTSPDLCL